MYSIKHKSMLILSGTTVVVMTAIFIVAYSFAQSFYTSLTANSINQTNKNLAVVLQEPIFAYDKRLATNIAQEFVNMPHVHSIRISDHRNQEIANLTSNQPIDAEATHSSPRLDVTWSNGNVIGHLDVTYRNDNYAQNLYYVRLLLIGIAAILIVILQAVNWFVLSRYVTSPINKLGEAMKDIAQGHGDLTRRINIQRDDEIGLFVSNFNGFIAKLDKMVGDTVRSAEALLACSNHIKTSAHSNDVAAHQQIGVLNEFSRSLDEMRGASHEMAEGARVTSEKTQSCNDIAIESSQVVKSTATEINELGQTIEVASNKISNLRDKSQAINTVLHVIKEIAEQTNLLALNAAIEAARAGEQGRGFAVVADEVRALAKRTQDSTAEIENIINELDASSEDANKLMIQTQENVSKTIADTAKTIEAIEIILGNVHDINQMNASVATAAEQEKAVSEGVVSRIQEFDTVTHNAAANAVKVLDLSNELDQLGANIKADLSKFKLSA